MTIPLPPYSSIKPRKKKRDQVRVGKEGIVRLSGAAMDELRMACWTRDKGCCVCCGRPALLGLPDYHPDKYDMAHKRNKRMYGDLLSNVETMRHECHMRTHTEGREKEGAA
jgi:hypothetical protein